MKILIAFLYLLVSLNFDAKSCCMTRDFTLTEELYKDVYQIILTCRVISTEKDSFKDDIYKAEVIETFFGNPSSKIISLQTGGNNSSIGGARLAIGQTYLIYSDKFKNYYQCFTLCDQLSKRIDLNDKNNFEIILLRQFSSIIRKKRSGDFIFSGLNNIVLAKGSYKKGKPINIWTHYYANGVQKTVYDFTNNTTFSYTEDGLLQSKIIKTDTLKISEIYSKNGADELLQIRTCLGPADSPHTYTSFLYKNGKLFKEEKRIGKELSEFIFVEYFENGQVSLRSQKINDRKTGKWIYYNEDGTIRKEEDYNVK
nr:hypothetical protein [Chitinophagaceae bacterium]